MKLYFAAVNGYASESSQGFANTWGVLAFETREARDNYVDNARDLATKAINRDEVPRYVEGDVQPFSGRRYMIGIPARNDIPGLIGEVYIGTRDDPQAIRPLNNG